MIKTLLIILLTLYGLNSYAQDMNEVLQKSIEFDLLITHLKKNQAINFGHQDFIKDNGIIPKNSTLMYAGKPLTINIDDGSDVSFFYGYTFEFLKVKINRKKANVVYQYYPRWFGCEKKASLSQSMDWFYRIELEFVKNGEWEISEYKLIDLDVTKLTDCKREEYIEIE